MNLQQNGQEETSKLYEEESSYRLTNFNFRLNLEPYDPYFPVIESKTSGL